MMTTSLMRMKLKSIINRSARNVVGIGRRVGGVRNGFAVLSKKSRFLDRVPIEHIDMKNSRDFELHFDTICSVEIHSIL